MNTVTKEINTKHRKNRKKLKAKMRKERENKRKFVSHEVTFGNNQS